MIKLERWIVSLRVFGWLLLADMRSLWKDFFNNLIDATAWPVVIIFINGIIMPAMGLDYDYGAFTTVSIMVNMGFYSAWIGSMLIAADLSGAQTISYELTLPLPYWMVWLKKGLFLSIRSALFNTIPLLIGKIILGDIMSFHNFSFIKFILLYTISSLFFGMFALWSTVITKTHEAHSRLELRLVGPMVFLNGWASSWLTMYEVAPKLGLLTLCLPWVYAYEGCRAAILGQEGYIDIWICFGMLLFFTILLAGSSVWLFKKRMDCA